MSRRVKCFLGFFILISFLFFFMTPVNAQTGIEYAYLLNLPSPTAHSIWTTAWTNPLQGNRDILSSGLNYAYLYSCCTPITQFYQPKISFPWQYFYKSSPTPKTKPKKLPFEDIRIIEMGPLYAQLFESYRYLFVADYKGADMAVRDVCGHEQQFNHIFEIMLDPDNFITDPNETRSYWISRGADPDKFDAEPDPVISAMMGREFTVDTDLPIFVDTNMFLGGSTAERLIQQGTLDWDMRVISNGATGNSAIRIKPLPVDPYDGMPTYLTSNDSSFEAIAMYGKSYYNPTLVFLLESALWNAGLTIWPNIAALDFTPDTFDSLVVRIEAGNGVDSDVVTFPIDVVHYPVNNYDPVLCQQVEDQTFYVGEVGQYPVNFIDPDCFVFSMSPPPPAIFTKGFRCTGTFREDMDGMTWGLTINNLPSYQYGPWIEQIVHPEIGLIAWVPVFEGTFDVNLMCMDENGGMCVAEFVIAAKIRGGRPNHHPVVLNAPTGTVTIKAGEEYILTAPDLIVEDPDGDQVYAHCNIGEISRGPDDSFIWKFQGNNSGSYMVELIFYDIRGGYAIREFVLEVKP